MSGPAPLLPSGVLLGIDGGGSTTKWALFAPDGAVLSQGNQGALTGHLFTPQDEAAALALLRGLAEDLTPAPAAVVAGVSGLQRGAVPVLRAAIADAFGLPDDRIVLTHDLELAYAAHFRPGEGVLVYAGTGSMAYHRTAAGEELRAGGHGFLLGDEGGAFWQGGQGLRALLRQQDQGARPSGPLAQELGASIGPLDWPQIRQFVYGGGREAVASLAPAVYRAAQAGDPAALDVQQRAGAHLAELARTLSGRCPPGVTVSLTGGAANDLVRAAFQSARPGVQSGVPASPVLGAYRLSPLRPPPSLEAPP